MDLLMVVIIAAGGGIVGGLATAIVINLFLVLWD